MTRFLLPVMLAMANLLQQGAAWLSGQLDASAATSVTLTRPGNAPTSVLATIGSTPFEVTRADGSIENIQSRDFLIAAANYLVNGVAVLPARGDQISEGGFIYQVMAPGHEPHYRFVDPFRTRLRVHTKQVG